MDSTITRPSRTLFLVTSPEVLHAGTPTLLAVTFLADFPGRVVAEVEHGNTRVAQSEDFQGGDAAKYLHGISIIMFEFKAKIPFSAFSRFNQGPYSSSCEY